MLYFGETIKRRNTAGLFILFFADLIPATAGQLGTLVVVGDSLSAGFQNGVLGSIAKLRTESARVEVHADHAEQSVQGTPIPGRGDCSVRPDGTYGIPSPTSTLPNSWRNAALRWTPVASGDGCRPMPPS
jgi:hypothetical protein